MKIEKTEVYGFKASLRALRNPKDSWHLSDSQYTLTNYPELSMKSQDVLEKNYNIECLILGKADQKLSQQLTKAGSSHCKHLRMIQVWVDLTLPRYIWTEFDTYKHTEKVSCSTMHKLMSYDLTEDMFEGGYEDIDELDIIKLQKLIVKYNLEKDLEAKKRIKLKVKRRLPESFLQKRTINTNYQQLMNINIQREYHELPEWNPIHKWIINLPYFTELTGIKS